MKKARTWFFLLHALLLLMIPASSLYLFAVQYLPKQMTGCLLHDFLFLYCPVCGGTRAVGAMLSLDFLSAFRYNALLPILALLFLCLDAVAWRRLFKGKNPFYRLPVWFWVLCSLFVVLFFVGRNLLMIFGGWDPLGDLGGLWRIIMRTRT